MVPFGQEEAKKILSRLERYKHFRTTRQHLGLLGGAVKANGHEDSSPITIQDVLSHINALYSVGLSKEADKLARRVQRFKNKTKSKVTFSVSLEGRLLSRDTSSLSRDLSRIVTSHKLVEPFEVKYINEQIFSEDNAVWISMLAQLGRVDDALAVYDSLKESMLHRSDLGLLHHRMDNCWTFCEYKSVSIERHYICSTENILWALALDDLSKVTGDMKYRDEAYAVIQAMKSVRGFKGHSLITDEGFVKFGISLADTSNSRIPSKENLASAEHIYSKNFYLWVGALSRFEDLKGESEQYLKEFENTAIINGDGVVYHRLRKRGISDQTVYSFDQGIRARALLSLGLDERASDALDAAYRLNGLRRDAQQQPANNDGVIELGRKTGKANDLIDKRLYVRDVCDLATAVSGRNI
jgi:hypothetical protein